MDARLAVLKEIIRVQGVMTKEISIPKLRELSLVIESLVMSYTRLNQVYNDNKVNK